MNLPLDIVRTTGRAQKAITSEVLRPLGEADLAMLAHEKGSTTPPLKRLRDRHHALARLLAAGKKPGEAAAICAYDTSRVSILQNDPAFQELVKLYRQDIERTYATVHEQLAGLSLDVVAVIRERVEDDPDKIPMGTLVDIAKMAADRTGNGPKSVSEVNVNVNLASRLEEARKRLASRTLELTAVRTA